MHNMYIKCGDVGVCHKSRREKKIGENQILPFDTPRLTDKSYNNPRLEDPCPIQPLDIEPKHQQNHHVLSALPPPSPVAPHTERGE